MMQLRHPKQNEKSASFDDITQPCAPPSTRSVVRGAGRALASATLAVGLIVAGAVCVQVSLGMQSFLSAAAFSALCLWTLAIALAGEVRDHVQVTLAMVRIRRAAKKDQKR